jgi:Lrp/AsnC family leucine-responsive transcriptional regulator
MKFISIIDSISLKILKILQKKARIPNIEIARQVGLAPSAVLERIRKLERRGIISGYEVRLNPGHFGKALVAFVTVKMEKSAGETRLGDQLAAIADVQEVHFVAGTDAFLVKIRGPDPEALGRLIRDKIKSIAGVHSTHTAIVLSTYKETARLHIE